jgi:tRNA uridine 5-carboxymethylaminomethyl modification enzyme
VLIDDLVTRGTREPYRMLTSRAEYRLQLRADNADQRLTSLGIAIGAVASARAKAWTAKKDKLAAARALAASLSATPNELARHGLQINEDGVRRAVPELLRRPDLDIARLAAIFPALAGLDPAIAEQIEIDARYAGYVERQDADIRAFRKDEALELPANIDYAEIGSLSTEVRQLLTASRPVTLGAAARIPGITPAALTSLLRHVRRRDDRRCA